MTILVATDFSPATTTLCAEAARWAARLGGETTLLHVVHDPVLAPALTHDVPGDVARAKAKLRALADAMPVGAKVTTEVLAADDVPAAILARAARSDVRFVFLCSSNKSMLDTLRLGSVAAKVVRGSPVPVVCFPPTAPARDAAATGGVLLTTDRSDESQRAFAPTFALARQLGLPVTLCGVAELAVAEPLVGVSMGGDIWPGLAAEWKEALTRLVATMGVDPAPRVVVEAGVGAASAICECIRREGAAYVAMATHGRSGLRRFLLGSVTEAVLARSPVPVIVFPPASA
jgi:nucleotide-binding universal stress UspA family protein